VRILDGGWQTWLASGRPVSTATPTHEPATFTPRADPRRRLSTSDVRAFVGSGEAVLVDTRSPAEFLGQQATTGRFGAHPGRAQRAGADAHDAGTGTFRDADEVSRLLRGRGVPRDRRVVTYDTTGLGAAKAAFVLNLLGYADVAVYDGGWPNGALATTCPSRCSGGGRSCVGRSPVGRGSVSRCWSRPS
jgi:thiosulfate/3-mercaptopyruvate sulfurtransferase